MEASFDKFKGIKTYSRFNTTKLNNGSITVKSTGKKDPLTTKNAVKFLLEGSLRLKVCRYCLSVTSPLSELDEILVLAINGALHEVTIRDMVASFHPFKVFEDGNFPNKICKDCLNRTMGCYLFAQQCERAERALRNCFEDMYDKFEKLDPVEPVKRRGKPKLNPNSNILYTEHNEVIDYAEPIINIINTDSLAQDDTNIGELECQKCWQVLPTAELLLNHEKIHPKTMWYNCRLCGKSFVKRCHLRKHLKLSHKTKESNNEIQTYNDTNFKCNDCGYSSKLLGDHLQHIEKHKFKYMFEHLIERNVEKFCAVCMEKGSRMVDLNEVIHLHGGYPALSGDMTIQNILTATIPGQNSYKYQELPIYNKTKMVAKRMVTKRKIHTDFTEHKQFKNKLFNFSRPILVVRYNIESTNSNIYTFPKPYLINSFKSQALDHIPSKDSLNNCNINNMMTNDNMEENHNIEGLQTNKPAFEKNISYSYRFSKPFMLNNIETAKNNYDNEKQAKSAGIINEIAPPCKICWIFKKPNCKDCKTQSGSTNGNVNFKNMLGETKYYNWIFETSGKFSNTNTIFEDNNTFDKSEYTTDIDIQIKKFNSTPTTDDKYIWKCTICLSSNNNYRETCICCEKNKNDTKNCFRTNIISHIKVKTDNIIEKNEVVVLLKKDNYKVVNNNTLETPMEIEITPRIDDTNHISIFNYGIKSDYIEEMEISYDETKSFPLEFSNEIICSDLNKPQKFKFNTGADHNDKRNVMKKRRMPTRSLSRKNRLL